MWALTRERILFHILIFVLLSATLSYNGKQRFVHGGLIDIYHKYRPATGDVQQQSSNKSKSADDVKQLLASRNSEYASPMKRIMDLIGHHSPLIVLSSDQTGSNSQEQTGQVVTQKQEKLEPTTTGSASQLAPTSEQQQAWPSVDVNHGYYSPSMAPMSAQPQQLIQTSVPYEQYFLDPNSVGPQQSLANSMMGGQIALLSPANLAFHQPTAGYQQIATIPYPTSESAPQQFQQQRAMQSSLEDRAQPIFLSSYVPEIPLHLVKQPDQQTQQQRPDSIQQVQFAQQLPVPSSATSVTPTPKVEPGKSLSGNNDDAVSGEVAGKQTGSNNDDSDDSPSGGSNGDVEEPAKLRKEPDESDEPTSANGGSVVYEDKYDSDRDDTSRPAASGSNNNNQEQKSASSNSLVSVGLNDDCLQCICRASSGCDHLLRCITRGTEEKYCGPFQLTEEYWNKAGSPGDQASNFISFEDCANDADCAVETVTNYMKKYHKDCDGDENITCMDYARLHRLRPDECDNTDKLVNHFDAYWAKFQRCAEGYNRSRNGDDEEI